MFISSRHPSTTPLPCGEIPSFPPRSSTHLHPSTQPFYKNSFFPPKTLAEICVFHDNTLHLQTDISSFCCTSKHYNKGALNLLLHQPSSMKFRHLLPFLCSWFMLVGFCIKTQAQNFVSSPPKCTYTLSKCLGQHSPTPCRFGRHTHPQRRARCPKNLETHQNHPHLHCQSCPQPLRLCEV